MTLLPTKRHIDEVSGHSASVARRVQLGILVTI
jgi:hypothetical protein